MGGVSKIFAKPSYDYLPNIVNHGSITIKISVQILKIILTKGLIMPLSMNECHSPSVPKHVKFTRILQKSEWNNAKTGQHVTSAIDLWRIMDY